MKNTELAWAILVDPKSCFMALREQPRFWFPLLATVVSGAAVIFWYYSMVDFAWLTDHILSGNSQADKMSEAEKAKLGTLMSKNILMWTSLAVAVIGIPLMRLLESVYYLLAGKLTGVQQSFKHWFSLSCWSAFPLLLAVVAMAVSLLIQGNGQIGLEGLQPLSLNELLFHVPASNRWYSLLTNLTILHPWVWWLTVVGVQIWSTRSLTFCLLFALLPVVFLYGGWALIALLIF